MKESFISKIYVKESRNVRDLEILLSVEERKHLIITGKNGSGKTSLFEEMKRYLIQVDKGEARNLEIFEDRLNRARKNLELYADSLSNDLNHKAKLEEKLRRAEQPLSQFGGTVISFKNLELMSQLIEKGQFLLTSFEAQRQSGFARSHSIQKVNLIDRYTLGHKVGHEFIKYLVNLKAERSFAKDDGEDEVARQIDEWFERLELQLQNLFDSPELKLQFDRKEYNFMIMEEGKLPSPLDNLAQGYSSVLNIISELILRSENHISDSYELQGIVLIDEIETHLHIDLQKKILPFLTSFFPKIQFIVTTHSPFVISSIPNAVICDLEKKTVIEDLSSLSYDAVVENYFDTDKYSEQIKQKVLRYEELVVNDPQSTSEKVELNDLDNYFKTVPKGFSQELEVKLQSIKLSQLNHMEG